MLQIETMTCETGYISLHSSQYDKFHNEELSTPPQKSQVHENGNKETERDLNFVPLMQITSRI